MSNAGEVTSTKTSARRRKHPGQGLLLFASAVAAVGAFLPWLVLPFGRISGMAGPGLWLFYAASLGLAGALVRSRRLASVQALLFGSAALALPAWQVARALDLAVPSWQPGAGMVAAAGAGAVALRAAWQLHRRADVEP